MIFPAKKLNLILNPVSFTQDQILTAFRLIAKALAFIKAQNNCFLCAELTKAAFPMYQEAVTQLKTVYFVLWFLYNIKLFLCSVL